MLYNSNFLMLCYVISANQQDTGTLEMDECPSKEIREANWFALRNSLGSNQEVVSELVGNLWVSGLDIM
jgi:hypothetical protein